MDHFDRRRPTTHDSACADPFRPPNSGPPVVLKFLSVTGPRTPIMDSSIEHQAPETQVGYR